MLRKPAFVLSSYTNICQCHAATPQLTPPASTRPPQPQCPRSTDRRSKLARLQRSRQYATLASGASAASEPPPEDHWPSSTAARNPTPYQILSAEQAQPYNKSRFFELVKLYHPDKNPSEHAHENPCGCSRQLMLERYRLLVLAHTILSDPDKRSAYDRYGTGWARVKESERGQWSTTHAWRDGKWDVDDNPMYCATWEDWERWYERQRNPRAKSGWGQSFFTAGMHPRHKQRQIFASNYTFISLVALLAALGGIGQATNAHEQAKSRVERARAISEENGRALMRARQDAQDYAEAGEGKEQRIRRFLRDREGYKEGEFDGRAAKADEGLCAPAMVKDRDQEPFWRRPPEVR